MENELPIESDFTRDDVEALNKMFELSDQERALLVERRDKMIRYFRNVRNLPLLEAATMFGLTPGRICQIAGPQPT